MKTNKISFLAVLILTGFAWSGFCANGTTGISSLDLEASGARQFAMGAASVGLAGDVNTITVNPSGLAILSDAEAGVMVLFGLGNSTYINGAVAIPLPSNAGVVGVDFMNFSTASFMGLDEFGNNTENIGMHDFAVTVGYANNIFRLLGLKQDLDVGISLKLGSSKIYNTQSPLFTAVDAGILYRIKYLGLNNSLSIGAAIQNIGEGVTFISDKTLLPMKFKIGAGFESRLMDQLTLSFAADYIRWDAENENSVNLGVEFLIIKMFAVQAGYKISDRQIDSFTVGGGVRTKISQSELNVNYALTPMGDLGLTHCISVGFKI